MLVIHVSTVAKEMLEQNLGDFLGFLTMEARIFYTIPLSDPAAILDQSMSAGFVRRLAPTAFVFDNFATTPSSNKLRKS